MESALIIIGGAIAFFIAVYFTAMFLSKKGLLKDEDNDWIPDVVEDKVSAVKADLAELKADLKATQELCNVQYKKLNTQEYAGLMESVILTNKVAVTLAKIYRNGFKVDQDKLFEILSNIDHKNAEALFVSCTSLPVLNIIEKLEKKLNMTVLSSNQTLIWETLESINRNNSIKGYGSLFS